MRIREILVIVLGLICLADVNAQSKSRLEFDIRPNEPQPEIIPVDRLGIIVFNPGQEKKDDGLSSLRFTFYNTEFEKVWEKDVVSHKKLHLSFYEYFDNAFYLIFNNTNKEFLEVVKIDPVTADIGKHEFFVLKGTQIKDFVVKNDQVVIGGAIKNAPLIQQMDLTTKKIKTLPSIVDGKSVVVQEVFINAKTNAISAVISSTFNKNKNVIVRTYEKNPGKFNDLVITSNKKFDFHTAKVTNLDTGDKLVLGSYGFRKNANTQGFYIAKFAGENQEFLKFYSFTELNNFFSFLDARDKVKIESKAERKKERGKELKINYRLLTHEVVSQGDQYIMIGEAYYPVYRQERFMDNIGYRRYFNYQTVFDGYEFTHAVIAGFSKDGDLIWDHSFKINNIKTRGLNEKVKAYVEPDDITLFYNLEGSINKLTIRDNKVDHHEETLAMATEYQNDRVKKADIGAAEYWYDNYFIAWGYQKIKNLDNLEVKKKRNIFYINKMSF